MTATTPGPGSTYLWQRSDRTRDCRAIAPLRSVVLIDARPGERGVISAILHMMLGYELELTSATTLGVGLDEISRMDPDLVVLQDRLPPQGDAGATMPLLRHCGYRGPIIVLMDDNQRLRRYHLLQSGAADAIASDDLDSVRIVEALSRCQAMIGADG